MDQIEQPPTSFVSWLLQQKTRNNGDEIGRLAREAAKDPTFPRTTNRLWIFLHYYDLELKNRNTVKKAHAEWRQFRDQNKSIEIQL